MIQYISLIDSAIFRSMFRNDNLGWLFISFCSGRAGREGPGKCFRLYPESEFEKLEDSTKPEIKRCNLSNVILQLKALGVDDIIGFDFLEKPSRWKFWRAFPSLASCTRFFSFFFKFILLHILLASFLTFVVPSNVFNAYPTHPSC